MCDCGHAFDALAAESARASGFVQRDQTHPAGPSKGAKIGVGILGYFAGAFPVTFIAEYRAALGGGETPALSVVSVVTGIIGVVVALRILGRRHESRSRKPTG
jgi:hypothetical protein